MLIRLTPKEIRPGYYNTQLIAYVTNNDDITTKGEYPTLIAFIDGKEVVVKEVLKAVLKQFKGIK